MIPCFVISLEHSIDRRARIAALLNALGVPFTFLNAHGDDGYARYSRTYKRNLMPGEVGCYLSHINAAKIIAASGAEFACVLEDDATLEASALSFLNGGALSSLGDFDILRLEGLFHGRFKPISNVDGIKVLAPLYPDGGTRAQIYSQRGANKIANCSDDIHEPIDVRLYFDPPVRRFRLLDVSPACAGEARTESIIGDRQNGRTSRYERLRYKVRRRLNFAIAWATLHPQSG